MWVALLRKFWEYRRVWMTAPGVAAVVIVVRSLGWFQPFEWMALDQFIRLRPREMGDPRIVIVGINDQDLTNLGHPTLYDKELAALIERIKQQKPRVIGLDLYRDLPVEPGYPQLEQVFKTTPNLIGIEKKGGGKDIPIPPSPVLAKLGQVSSNDILRDSDNRIRRGFLYWTSQDTNEFVESLGLRLALIYLKADGIQPKPAPNNPDYLQLGKASFPIFESNNGGYVGADAAGYQILINFRGPRETMRTVSLTDVMAGKVPADLMRDRIVLIGPTAESLKDFFPVPYTSADNVSGEMAGVEIQSNVASQIISSALDGRPGIQFWSDPQEWGWIFLWSCAGVSLAWLVRSPRWAMVGMVVAVGSLISICYFAFLEGWWIPVVPPVVTLVSSAMILTGYAAYQEREDRQTVMNLFGRHVTPEIAEAIWRDRNQLLQQGRLPGRKMPATVLFTDLKNFSGITERTEPETLMTWLNEYMEAMSKLVLSHGGVVDKFIGDSVMAVFGVPIPRTSQTAVIEDANRAVKCALEMAGTLNALNQKWQSQDLPTTSMRVGISTGMVIIGSLGGEQRLDYTTIGDSVNVAARLESYNKQMEGGVCRILISESTYLFVSDRFTTQFIDSVQLRGREQPIKIYQVLTEIPKSGD
jgi:adenylate cyclase